MARAPEIEWERANIPAVSAEASYDHGAFKLSLKIYDRWLALLAGGGIAAFCMINPQLVTDTLKKALEVTEGIVVGRVQPGSILVELHCHTKKSFLLFMGDFKTKNLKRKLNMEFRNIGYNEELEVTITNLKEAYMHSEQLGEELTLDDEACDAFGVVEKTDEGYRMSLKIPSGLRKFIVGKNGKTKRTIEKETDTSITIQGEGDEGDVVITGPQRSDVEDARKKIYKVLPPTHFLCFPLYQDNLKETVEDFKAKVREKCPGIDASLFQRPSKMHLTIGVLTLLSEREVKYAGNVLVECYEELVRNSKPVKIELKGVQYMNDDPAKVLYAKVNTSAGSESPQKLAEDIVEKFVSKCSIMMKTKNEVKLHATLIKAKPPAKESQTDDKNLSIDPEDKSFKDFNFGEYYLDAIHLSKMGSCDREGRYECVASASYLD